MSIELSPTDTEGALAADLAGGYTLPVSMYTDPDVLQREKNLLFRRHWQFAGLLQRVQEPGSYFTYWSGDVPILVVRDLEGVLRGYINVCRHRGSQLVLDQSGRRKSIQCHYHAWTWNLDGSLRAAPGAREETSFDESEYPLIPVQVATWGPFVFVNPDLQALPLDHFLGQLPEMVRGTGLRLDEIRSRERREYVIQSNWKIVVENYLECYHCPVAHPGFSDLIDVSDYRLNEFEYFSTGGGPLKDSSRRKTDAPYNFGTGVEEGFYAYIWPTFTLNIYPGPGNVSLNLILPEGVDRTRMVYEFCFADEVREEDSNAFITFINQVQLEDTELCESVQRGMRSGYWERGKLMLCRESGLRHFQQLWYREFSRQAYPS